MNLADIRSGLATRLGTVSGIRVYSRFPAEVVMPAVVIGAPSGVYGATLGRTSNTVTFPLYVLVNANDLDRAQKAMDLYLDDDTTSASSLVAAIEADPDLASEVGSAQVTTFSVDGVDNEIGGVPALRATLTVEVYT